MLWKWVFVEWLHYFLQPFLFIHSTKYSVKANYVPSTVLGSEDTVVIQEDKPSCPPRAYVLNI